MNLTESIAATVDGSITDLIDAVSELTGTGITIDMPRMVAARDTHIATACYTIVTSTILPRKSTIGRTKTSNSSRDCGLAGMRTGT
jgi:hypothetical protein